MYCVRKSKNQQESKDPRVEELSLTIDMFDSSNRHGKRFAEASDLQCRDSNLGPDAHPKPKSHQEPI